MRLAQSILKRNFPSVDKAPPNISPSTTAFEKCNKPLGSCRWAYFRNFMVTRPNFIVLSKEVNF